MVGKVVKEFLLLLLSLVPGAVLLTVGGLYLLYKVGLLKAYGLDPKAGREGE